MRLNTWIIIIIAWIAFFVIYHYGVPVYRGYDNPGDGIIGFFFVPPFLILLIVTIVKTLKVFTKKNK